MDKQDHGRQDRQTYVEDSSRGKHAPAAVPSQMVQVQAGPVTLDGSLQIPVGAAALVLFVHGSGSSRFSPRNQRVAARMHAAGLGTLLFDLLTREEEEMDLTTRHLRLDIGLLARRAMGAVHWINHSPLTSGLRLGLYGASTGAAAALIAAAEHPEAVDALVLRDGRPDLAAGALPRVQAPVRLITSPLDDDLCAINKQALQLLKQAKEKDYQVVPGAGLLATPRTGASFEQLAVEWFTRHLAAPSRPGSPDK